MTNNKKESQIVPGQLSADQIKAHGEVKTRMGIIWFVGIICGILAIGAFIISYKDISNAKDIWVIIGPIISGAVSGTVGFLSGEKSSRN
jgi:hypothetical protein